MKLRTLLAVGLLGLAPSLVLAQSYAEAQTPSVAKAPRAARAAKVAVPALSATEPVLEFESVPPVPPAPAAPPAPVSEQPPTPPAAPKPASAPAPVAMVPPPPRPVGQMLNIQIEVTLSDSKSTPKTVVLTVADGELGQNRTNSASNAGTGTSYQTFTFNADGRPTIVGNKIRLYLSAEANIPAAADAKAGGAANISLRQQQTLILNDGDSLEIARASDPVSDRNFILSVKVKIQR